MSATILPMVPKTCPRCAAPTQTTPLTPPDEGVAYGCTRCTWPNPSWQRVLTTLAKKGVGPNMHDMTDEGLESVAANLPPNTVLKDQHGRRVDARVIEVRVYDGQVDVVFEFDPNGWQVPA